MMVNNVDHSLFWCFVMGNMIVLEEPGVSKQKQKWLLIISQQVFCLLLFVLNSAQMAQKGSF